MTSWFRTSSPAWLWTKKSLDEIINHTCTEKEEAAQSCLMEAHPNHRISDQQSWGWIACLTPIVKTINRVGQHSLCEEQIYFYYIVLFTLSYISKRTYWDAFDNLLTHTSTRGPFPVPKYPLWHKMYVLIPANVDKATKTIRNGRTLNLLLSVKSIIICVFLGQLSNSIVNCL